MLAVDHKTKRMASTFDHPPYSLELVPSDFHLLLHLTKYLAGKKFNDDDEVQEEVMP
jgi:hypothetical protein